MMREAGDWKYAGEIEAYRDIEDSAIDLCHEEFEAELTDEDGDEVEVYLSDPQNPESRRAIQQTFRILGVKCDTSLNNFITIGTLQV